MEIVILILLVSVLIYTAITNSNMSSKIKEIELRQRKAFAEIYELKSNPDSLTIKPKRKVVIKKKPEPDKPTKQKHK